jgi:hypothetical protein
MANTNAPFGFRQISGTGSAPTYEQVTMRVAYNNTTPIYFGDAVIPLSSGYIGQATASTVQVAGIFVGCKYLSTSMKRTVWSNWWPGSDVASTAPDVEAYIVNDPNAKFLVQAGGTAVGISAINANIQLNVGTGNATSGISGMYVETPATTATLPFRVVALVTDPPGANGTDYASAYNQIIVAFNYASTRTTDGV